MDDGVSKGEKAAAETVDHSRQPLRAPPPYSLWFCISWKYVISSSASDLDCPVYPKEEVS